MSPWLWILIIIVLIVLLLVWLGRQESRSIDEHDQDQPMRQVDAGTAYQNDGLPELSEVVPVSVPEPVEPDRLIPAVDIEPEPEPTVAEAAIVEPEPEPTVAEAAIVLPETEKPDDLEIIEGIGPKIAVILKEAKITSFAQLSEANVIDLRNLMVAANLRIADPTTWPEQARLAAQGNWDALSALQADLKGGRKVDS